MNNNIAIASKYCDKCKDITITITFTTQNSSTGTIYVYKGRPYKLIDDAYYLSCVGCNSIGYKPIYVQCSMCCTLLKCNIYNSTAAKVSSSTISTTVYYTEERMRTKKKVPLFITKKGKDIILVADTCPRCSPANHAKLREKTTSTLDGIQIQTIEVIDDEAAKRPLCSEEKHGTYFTQVFARGERADLSDLDI